MNTIDELVIRAQSAYSNNGVQGLSRGGRKIIFNAATRRLHPFGLGLRLHIWRKRRMSRNSVSKLARAGLGTPLDRVQLRQHKTSDSVFILGTGSSINNISTKEWRIVDQHDSIGINRWPIHEFTPTLHVFELPPGEKSSSFRTDFWDLLECKRRSYENVPVIMKNIQSYHFDILSEPLPDWLVENLVLSLDIELPDWTNTPERLLSVLDGVSKLGYFDEDQGINLLFRKVGSISYLLFMSVMMGYDNIILCGVDMNNSKHFFEEAPRYHDSGLPIPTPVDSRERDSKDVHRTMDPSANSILLDEVIYAVRDSLLQPRGISLYTSSKRSALYPEVPYKSIRSLQR